MEFAAERALKSSFLSGIATKHSQQLFIVDDGWVSGGPVNNNVGCDDFSVDDLLDFSDKEFKDGGSVPEDEGKESVLVSSQHRNSNSSSFSETDDDFGSLLSVELSLPPVNHFGPQNAILMVLFLAKPIPGGGTKEKLQKKKNKNKSFPRFLFSFCFLVTVYFFE